jgi:TRAP-type transport system periplasmic protein
MRRHLTHLAFSLIALGAGLPATASAEKPKHTMKMATVAPARTPWADLLKRYKKGVAKASNKAVKLRVYLGGVKGDEGSIVRQVFKGTLQAGGVSTGAMATLVPEMDILEMPYLFETADEADRILDGPARPIVDELLEAKGFKLLMYSENGYRSFGTKKGCVKSPADLKAVKMRSQESPVHVEMYRALGASPVTISVGEVMSSLQTGVVDGFDNTPLFTQAVSWHQGVKFFTLTEHIYQPALIVANKDWFDALPADIQASIIDPGKKLEKKGRKAVRALGPLLVENLRKLGLTVCELTPDEKKKFQEVARGSWEARLKNASPLGKKLFETIQAAKK